MRRILPAYPLFVKDPYFSFWSNGEELNGSDVMFWTGVKKTVVGVLTVDGEELVFLGNVEGAKKILQTDIAVTAYTTDYKFENEKVVLSVRFVSPLPLDDKKLLSCPVCYMQYEIVKKQECNVKISLAFNGDVCYNVDGIACGETRGEVHAISGELLYKTDRPADKKLRGKTFKLHGFETVWMGLKRQTPLSHAYDKCQADWGYWYLAGEKGYVGEKPYESVTIKGDNNLWIKAENESLSGNILVGFDDVVSIAYFGEWLQGYYFDGGKTIMDALGETWNNIPAIDKKLAYEDEKLRMAAKAYGEEYINVLYASLRQSIAAHKLVQNKKGELLWLSKECWSNGCIGTVDVSYPSMPLYLLADTEYVKGMMYPIFTFARMPVWEYDFAPHDVGTYPICGGQAYGLKWDKDLDDTFAQTHPDSYKYPVGTDEYLYHLQMPVEECANMLIMAYACYCRDHDESLIRENYDLLKKWVQYLLKYGLKPENQLCTDDFAGHLANNVNLAIKATVGIACFAKMNEFMGKDGESFRKIAEDYAAQIEELGEKYGHLPLTWDTDGGTFSLKYNLAFDKALGLNVFKKETLEREVDYYLANANEYGTPLDTRKEYTKSDWLTWAAYLTDDVEKRKAFMATLDHFLKNAPDRLAFCDWYETKTGEHHEFTNRSVQGGCFMLLL